MDPTISKKLLGVSKVIKEIKKNDKTKGFNEQSRKSRFGALKRRKAEYERQIRISKKEGYDIFEKQLTGTTV